MPVTKNYRVYWNKSQITGLFLITLLIFLHLATSFVFATHQCKGITDTDEQLECYKRVESEARDELSSAREKQADVEAQIEEYLDDLYVTQSQLNELQADINIVVEELKMINENLVVTEEHLAEKLVLRDSVLRAYYQSGKLSFLEFFLSQDTELNGFTFSTLIYAYDKSVTAEALELIKKLHAEIKAYEEDKAEAESLQADLEANQQSLLSLKADLDAGKLAAESEQEDIDKEISSLEDKIADLSAKQQEILAAKAGAGIISGYEAAEYKLPDPPFSPAFAAMSYGGYTHYRGMSQYGAKGRANDGKDYKDIIEFYYGEDVKKKDNFPDDICVEGYGEMSFQKYLYGLAEMPSSWPDDALKAQAIAGRSYAYNRTKNGGCICTTQSCQVFLKSKSDNPPDSWKDAVDDTKDRIIGGDTGKAGYGWYSSTAGGYIENIGWDEDGDWPGDAYEKKAKSPWFYKAWYTQSYRDSSGTCGRNTPWLNEKEMADILNSWVVWENGSGSERDRISPVTDGCWSGDPYSHSKMKEKAEKYGDAYDEVNSVSVSIGNNGRTATVHFSTDEGNLNISGEDFKTVFNLRAPAYVSLRSRLFDIEHED